MTQEHLIQELKDKFKKQISSLQSEVESELDLLQKQFTETQNADGSKELMECLQKFREGYTQANILNILLDCVGKIVPRVLFLIVKDRLLHGFAARGFERDFMEGKVKKIHWGINAYPELRESINSMSMKLYNYSDLGSISDAITELDDFSPVKSAFIPIQVRGKVAGLLYLDSGATMELPGLGMIENLAHVAGMELTMITAKLKKKPANLKYKVPAEPASQKRSVPGPDQITEKIRDEIPVQQKSEPASEPHAESEEDRVPGKPQTEMLKPPIERAGNKAIALPSADDTPEVKKAKRVARVLISDLILYNQDKVNEGRNTGNLYNLLKEDIDRSYDHYQGRVKELVPEEPNYFKEELVRCLAEGDRSLLGVLPF
ncbi:MAG: hypothetical protein CSA81_08190 [Acidobacteria bacterium]|nr:MAG: hypothetical protein CSA81_08190 [Acidobacteriota bacterium]PIE89704.1 MAG: hypothetical protein CR997_09725 [Acidobacteriota bacterium]